MLCDGIKTQEYTDNAMPVIYDTIEERIYDKEGLVYNFFLPVLIFCSKIFATKGIFAFH